MKTSTFVTVLLAAVLITPSLGQAQVQGDVAPTQSSSSCINLRYDMQYRATDATTGGEVSKLQDFLQSKGYLNSEPTGYFGLLTQAAVRSYQSASGILNSGYVGPITRGKIQSASCGAANTTPAPTTAAGCPAGARFSSLTGKACDGSTPSYPPGCSSATGYSSENGKACDGSTRPQPVYLPGCTSFTGYSSANGNACDGSTPSYPPGCSSATGWSSTTGASCLTGSPSVSGTFSARTHEPEAAGGARGYLTADYSYQIQNYRSGLVLDVEPTYGCDDTLIAPRKRECDMYLLDLSKKGGQSYRAVTGNPYVKGGALYRFTGQSGTVDVVGAVMKVYASESPYIDPIPHFIDFRFILRDLNQGGKELWSTTNRAQLWKG